MRSEGREMREKGEKGEEEGEVKGKVNEKKKVKEWEKGREGKKEGERMREVKEWEEWRRRMNCEAERRVKVKGEDEEDEGEGGRCERVKYLHYIRCLHWLRSTLQPSSTTHDQKRKSKKTQTRQTQSRGWQGSHFKTVTHIFTHIPSTSFTFLSFHFFFTQKPATFSTQIFFWKSLRVLRVSF